MMLGAWTNHGQRKRSGRQFEAYSEIVLKGETSKYPSYLVRREFGDCSLIIVGGGAGVQSGGVQCSKAVESGGGVHYSVMPKTVHASVMH